MEEIQIVLPKISPAWSDLTVVSGFLADEKASLLKREYVVLFS